LTKSGILKEGTLRIGAEGKKPREKGPHLSSKTRLSNGLGVECSKNLRWNTRESSPRAQIKDQETFSKLKAVT